MQGMDLLSPIPRRATSDVNTTAPTPLLSRPLSSSASLSSTADSALALSDLRRHFSKTATDLGQLEHNISDLRSRLAVNIRLLESAQQVSGTSGRNAASIDALQNERRILMQLLNDSLEQARQLQRQQQDMIRENELVKSQARRASLEAVAARQELEVSELKQRRMDEDLRAAHRRVRDNEQDAVDARLRAVAARNEAEEARMELEKTRSRLRVTERVHQADSAQKQAVIDALIRKPHIVPVPISLNQSLNQSQDVLRTPQVVVVQSPPPPPTMPRQAPANSEEALDRLRAVLDHLSQSIHSISKNELHGIVQACIPSLQQLSSSVVATMQNLPSPSVEFFFSPNFFRLSPFYASDLPHHRSPLHSGRTSRCFDCDVIRRSKRSTADSPL